MNDRQIQCFLEAGRLLNFTRAAESLTLPQPAVSRYISSLEEELGVSLFIRESNRKVILSEAGKTYYNFFLRFSAEFSHTKRLLSGPSPALALGFNTGWKVSGFLPDVVARCGEKLHDFRITFQCQDFKELVEALKEKRLNAALTMESYLAPERELEYARITSIRRCVCYSERLPGFERIGTISDLYPCDFFLVDDPRVQLLNRDAEDLFLPYQFFPRFVTAPNLETVFAYVENGLGAAVLDRWCGILNTPGVHALSLDSTLPLALAWRKHGRTPAIDVFLEELQRHFQS